ncbi:C40 family peptidase [Paenibacillus sp. GSMTC-2017]|nr:C40 family peptidase [Paenibacillus sp. GSMTC-2017]
MKNKIATATITAALLFGSVTIIPAPSVHAAQSAEVTWGVNMRTSPSSTASVIRMLKKGEQISIIDKANGTWYKVSDAKGKTGYISSSSKYTKLGADDQSNGSGSAGNGSTAGSGNTGNNSGSSNSGSGGSSNGSTVERPSTSTNSSVEKVISAGMKYLGTPYEFGSNRSTTTTFDCSDFTKQVFKEGLGITLPSDSRQQGDYVKNKGNAVTSISKLKRGDLMFFMSYKGTGASSYSGVNKSSQRITHVGIYLGNGQVLHTYSKESGGVRTNSITGTHWEHRFLYGGSAQ